MLQHRLRPPRKPTHAVIVFRSFFYRLDDQLDQSYARLHSWSASQMQLTGIQIDQTGKWASDLFPKATTAARGYLHELSLGATHTKEFLASVKCHLRKSVRLYLKSRYWIFALQAAFFTLLIATALTISGHTTPASAATANANKNTKGMEMISNTPNLPQIGSLKFGLYTDNPDISAYERLLGKKVDIMAWFAHWNDNLASNKLRYVCENGYIPEITWESWDGQTAYNAGQGTYALSDIAQGKYDSLITQSMQEIKDVCQNQTVIIRFDHEMDTAPGVVSWYPWQGDPQAYVAAWQHVVSLARTIDPNIKWLWAPNRGTSTAEQYYPGNKWVDYVGLTLNRGTLEANVQSFAQFYTQNQSVIESFGKPVLIGETTDSESLGEKPAWVTGMFHFAESDPNIVGLVWFNGTIDYSFNSSTASLNAFQQSLQQLDRGSK